MQPYFLRNYSRAFGAPLNHEKVLAVVRRTHPTFPPNQSLDHGNLLLTGPLTENRKFFRAVTHEPLALSKSMKRGTLLLVRSARPAQAGQEARPTNLKLETFLSRI
jgi:hypothetical protein